MIREYFSILTPLQYFFVISGVVITIVAFGIARRERFNALHFLAFLSVGIFLVVATIFPGLLDRVGRFFGVDRWAYALVYVSIIFLIYFSLLLLEKIEGIRTDITYLVREIAIKQKEKDILPAKVTFVIAAYNEAKIIEKTIRTIFSHGYNRAIVVDDGSRDGSREILRDLEIELPWLTVLEHYKNRGQWAALETGFEYIRRYGKTDYVVTFDADGQHDIEDLSQFIKVLDEDSTIDVVLGSRFLSKKPKNIPFLRRLILRLGILFTYFISKIRLSDTHNGYRAFRSKVLSKVKISLDGMEHASEILDIIASEDLHYREVPVTIRYDEYSLAKWQHSSNAFHIGFRMIWKKFFR
jgi:polyprenyl-phospho-N-acetylgalactosaminyl synthase